MRAPLGGFATGILGSALIGMGAAALTKRFVGAPLGSYTGAAAGFLVAGVPGAVSGFAHDNLGNVMPGGQTVGAGGSSAVIYG